MVCSPAELEKELGNPDLTFVNILKELKTCCWIQLVMLRLTLSSANRLGAILSRHCTLALVLFEKLS